MADVNITVDFNDLRLLNNELNNTDKKIKLTAKDARREFASMKRSIDPLYNAMKTFEGKVLVAQRAVATGAISNKEYVRSLDMIRNQAAMAGVQVNQLGQVTALTANRMNKFGSVGMQQVGYQVGDFLVQVQSGTNAMVAFGQQATQLVGVLGMMNKSLIPISAVLGIAIPLVTALGAAWMRTRGSTDAATESLKTLEDQLKSIDATLQDWINTKKAAEAGVTVQEMFGVQGLEEAKNTLKEAEAALKEYEDFYGKGGQDPVALVQSIFGWDAASKYEAAIKARDEAEARVNNIRQKEYEDRIARTKEIMADLERERRAEAEETHQALLNYQGEREKALLDANAAYEAEQDAIRKAAKKAAAQDLEAAEGILSKHQDLVTLLSMEKQFGEGSLALSRAKRELDLQNLITEIDSLDITTAKKDELINTVAVAASLADELERAQWATQNMTSGDGFWALGMSGSDMLPPEPTKPKPSVKSPEQQLKERMQSLLKEVRLRERIKGLSEDEQRREELRFDYQKLNMEANEDLIDQIVSIEAATRKYIEAEEMREQQIDAFSDHMEDAFEAMITGSKSVGDSFRDMLRNMLLDIYRQKVMEPMANTITNSIFGMFMANGGAFSNGVQMFADGGVVNSPTMFGHSNGLGVMGEAGPEAIMPLKRGPDGKLGVAGASGGNVTVNQTFQFTANGDESVKKIIAQAAPQIANMTQKQIMDSRRRGGQMKATFN